MVKNNNKINDQFESLLDAFDLSGKSRDAFSICFFEGPLPAVEIAKKTKINRAAAYQILNHLLEKKLIKKHQSFGKKQLFDFAGIENLKTLLSSKKEQLDFVIKYLSELPLSIRKSKSDSLPDIFGNSYSLKKTLEKATSDSKSDIYLIASVDHFKNIYDGKIFKSFLEDLFTKKINLNILVPFGGEYMQKYLSEYNFVKIKFLEKSDYPFSNSLMISDKYLFMFSWDLKEPKGLIISDFAIRQTYFSLFMLLWGKNIYSKAK